MDIKTILWMFMLGAAVAIIVVFYNNRFLGKLVRALIAIDASTPETALTPDELGIKLTPMLKYALRPGTSFSQTVIKTEDDRYYIAPNKLEMAKAKYRTKDVTMVFVMMSIIIIVIAALAVTYIFPEAVDSFTQQMTELFGDGGSL